MEEKRTRRIGPVTVAASLGAAAFGSAGVIWQWYFLPSGYFLPPEVARGMLVGGVSIGAMIGIGLGIAWEENMLPTERIAHVWHSIFPYAWRCGLAMLIVVVARVAYDAIDRRQNNLESRMLAQAEGRRMGDRYSIQFMGAEIADANLAHVRPLVNTQFLVLYDTSVRGPGLANISDWRLLRHLYLNNNPIANDGIAHLEGLTQLEILEIANSSISDDGLKHLGGMQNLTRLNLSSTAISDAGLRHLAPLKSLRTLGLGNTAVTEEGVAALQSALPNCQIGWKRMDPYAADP